MMGLDIYVLLSVNNVMTRVCKRLVETGYVLRAVILLFIDESRFRYHVDYVCYRWVRIGAVSSVVVNARKYWVNVGK